MLTRPKRLSWRRGVIKTGALPARIAGEGVGKVNKPRSAAEPPPGAARRLPGRPRSSHIHRQILEAAESLLYEGGYRNLSMEGVALRAGVAKTTVYRRWPSMNDLVADVLEAANRLWPMPQTAGKSLAEDLAELYRNWVSGLAGGGRSIPALIAEAVQNRAVAQLLQERFIRPRRRQAIAMVRSAVERGELPTGTDAEDAIDMFMGRMWYRRLVTGEEVRLADQKRVVELLLDGLRGRPSQA